MPKCVGNWSFLGTFFAFVTALSITSLLFEQILDCQVIQVEIEMTNKYWISRQPSYRCYPNKLAVKAVGETRDRWINGSRRGLRARPRPRRAFFSDSQLHPRTLQGISNFAKTRTRSRWVVFQKSNSTLNQFWGIYTPCPAPTPLNKLESVLFWIFWNIWWISAPKIWGGRSSPPPPSCPLLCPYF